MMYHSVYQTACNNLHSLAIQVFTITQNNLCIIDIQVFTVEQKIICTTMAAHLFVIEQVIFYLPWHR